MPDGCSRKRNPALDWQSHQNPHTAGGNRTGKRQAAAAIGRPCLAEWRIRLRSAFGDQPRHQALGAAKGWREKGEPPYRAAEREAEEEAGIIGKTARRMLGEYAYDKRFPRGRVRRCLVAVYPVKVQRLLDQWPEISMRERRWMPLAQAAASVDEPGLAALIAAFKGDAGSEPGKAPSVLAGAA